MYSNEDIERLIQGKTNSEESLLFIRYLDEHPDILGNYFSISEWEHFKSEYTLDAEVSSKIWQNIAHTNFKTTRTVELFKKLSIAASFVLLIGLGWWAFMKNENIGAKNKVPTEVISMKMVENINNFNINIILPDSSQVELFPNSTLSYLEKFSNHERGAKLIGEAIFKVTKDNTSPFLVSSDSLVTTVLGTKFRVQSFKGENTIKVILYEGKVSVKSVSLNPKSSNIDYILSPGDIYVYNKISMKSTLMKNSIDPIKNNITRNAITTATSISHSSNWYMFNNQKLSDVFDLLSILYNEKIHYNKRDIIGRTFIGKIDKTDSLQNILKSIGLLNKLIVTKEEDGYHIIKK
jgi:hypothetical protein